MSGELVELLRRGIWIVARAIRVANRALQRDGMRHRTTSWTVEWLSGVVRLRFCRHL